MTENTFGRWHIPVWGGAIVPASPTGVLALGFVSSGVVTFSSVVTIDGISEVAFSMIDLTENEQSDHPEIKYRGGIQSVDKGFTASPINIPIPQEFPVGFDIGFIESAVFTIAGVWFDGLEGRDGYLEDIRTSKKLISEPYRQSPLILVVSNRAYPVLITGYSSNIVGGQGNIISFRLGLAISSLTGHYNYSG